MALVTSFTAKGWVCSQMFFLALPDFILFPIMHVFDVFISLVSHSEMLFSGGDRTVSYCKGGCTSSLNLVIMAC